MTSKTDLALEIQDIHGLFCQLQAGILFFGEPKEPTGTEYQVELWVQLGPFGHLTQGPHWGGGGGALLHMNCRYVTVKHVFEIEL